MKQNKIIEWKLHSKTYEYKKSIKSVITIINRAKRMDVRFAISWSGGKDSTVMTHIVKKIWPECPIIVQFDDCDWPEKKAYIYRICKKMNWIINETYPDFSIWEYVKKCKIGEENLCSKSHKLTKLGFLKPLNDIRKKLKCEGSFVGLRTEESKRRKRGQKYNGNIYKLKSGEIICIPIVYLSVKDVFAYHIVNDIEINPCYFNNAIWKPEEIRLSWALPTIYGISKGDLEHMRIYYPEHFREFRELGVYQ